MIEMTAEKLKEKYYDSNNRQLAKELNISVPTLMNILKSNNIELKGKGYGSRAKIRIVKH